MINWHLVIPFFFWGAALGMIFTNIYFARRRANGHRNPREDDHRRAPDAPSPAALSALLAQLSAGGPAPAGEAAGDDSDPRSGDSPSVEGVDPDAKAPDAIEPIYAWRAWTVKPDGTLYATNQETTWLPGRATEAYCRGGSHGLGPNYTSSGHLAPHENCGCGLYAAKDVADIMYSAGGPFLWGECALWGKICVYSKGYRAQFGYPARSLKLYFPAVHGIFEEKPTREAIEAAERLARKVSDLYGVPVAVASEAEGKTLGIGQIGVTRRGSVSITTGTSTSNFNYAPGTITTYTNPGVQQWTQTTSTTSYTPSIPRAVPPNPSGFTTYSSYGQFQEHQQKAMKAVAEAMAEAEKRKRDALRKASVERANAMQRAYEAGIVIPKPGDLFLDSGQARAAYEFDDPTQEENSRAD